MSVEREHRDKEINSADLERENERLRRQLAELDELPRRKGGGTVSELKGVPHITTSSNKGVRSIPRRDDRYYLDLYLLQKERQRLVRETVSIKKRMLQLGMKVYSVDKEMADKEEKALRGMMILSHEPPTSQADEKSAEEKATSKKQKASKRYESKEGKWNRLTVEY